MEPLEDALSVPFAATAMLRFVGVILQSVTPLLVVDALGRPAALAGFYMTIFWVAVGAGAIAAVTLVRDLRTSGTVGFSLTFVSLLGFAAAVRLPYLLPAFFVMSGAGAGMVQPVLAPAMHAAAPSGRPYRGVGYYSTALSLGLISGTSVASATVGLAGFSPVFLGAAAGAMLLLLRMRRWGAGGKAGMPSWRAFRETVRKAGFGRSYGLGVFYSSLLPVVLSYSGIYAESAYGMTSSQVLLLLAAVFTLSLAVRLGSLRVRAGHFGRALVFPVLVLVASFLLMGFSGSASLFVLGMLLFSVPHALLYPWTLFNALQAAGKDNALAAGYAFATSSGVGEFLAPSMAAFVIAFYGLRLLFPVMTAVALLALVWALAFFVRDVGLPA
ncbi:MAG: hypothetical protein JRN29_05930 [Nitrososphaerota archaeon]|nr:hypothetical protein [Nitrososphaerota archaeon]